MPLSPLGSRWEPLVRSVASELAPSESFAALPSICRLLDLVCEWNARIDLTAARGSDELVDLFVADAIVLATRSAIEGVARPRWVDVGSGSGAPGLVLALLRPELAITLVEPRAKRVAFLRSALGVLGRAEIELERARSDELESGGFDVAVSRATLSPQAWLEEGARLARREVWVLLARGEAPDVPGWRSDLDLVYRWPLTQVERRALRFVVARHD